MKAARATSYASYVVSLAVVLSAISVKAIASDPMGISFAQPKTHKSPSGAYLLHVRPHDQIGRGSAAYRFTRDGREVWSGNRAFTLRGIAITDSGYVVGVAYRNVSVERDGIPWNPEEYFHVVILDAFGSEVVNDVFRRRGGLHSYSEPYARQVLVDEINDRVVFRIQGEERDCSDSRPSWGGPSWWIYHLSKGHCLAQFDPRERDPEVDERWRLVDARLIMGTPLILTHWYTSVSSDRPERRSGHFAVVGIDGRPVWSLSAEGDYARNQFSYRYVSSFFKKNPAILSTEESGQFCIKSFAANERLTFAIQPTDHGWAVDELAREPLAENP